MGEHAWTTFKIGGAIPRDKVDELKAIAKDEFMDSDGHPPDLIDEAIANKSPVSFAGLCSWGSADELAHACHRFNLPYWTAWDATPGAFEAGMKYWKPGMENPGEQNADCSGGEPMLTLTQLREAKNQSKSLLDIVAELERFVADLPPLSISDKDWVDPEPPDDEIPF